MVKHVTYYQPGHESLNLGLSDRCLLYGLVNNDYWYEFKSVYYYKAGHD